VAKRPLFRASGEVVADEVEAWKGTLNVVPTGHGATQRVYSGPASIPGSFVVEGLPPIYRDHDKRGCSNSIPGRNGHFLFDENDAGESTFAITDHDVEV
jgi:hypothetical protein